MEQEVSVTTSKKSSGEARGDGNSRADLVIWKSKEDRLADKRAFIVVELKAENVRVRVEDYYQGQNYASWAGASFFVTSNEKETKYMILTGALGKDGSVAIATRAEDAQSMLTVYNSKEKEIFVWKCAKENIISCDVSDNGKLFAVSVLGVENGSVYSKVYIFDRRKDTPKASFTYQDSAVSSIRFLSNETLFVLGNNMCSVIKDEKEENINVSVNTPYMIHISDNNTAVLVLSKYSSTTQKLVNVYDKSGRELFSNEIDGLVKSVSTDGKYVGVLTDNNVQIYNMKGELVGSANVNTDAEKVIVSGRNTYVYSADKIEKFSSVGENKEK